jgi:hypothetical protein
MLLMMQEFLRRREALQGRGFFLDRGKITTIEMSFFLFLFSLSRFFNHFTEENKKILHKIS